MTPNRDVSGHWDGIFAYPRQLPPTGFHCDLRDAAGLIVGETHEPQPDGPDLIALLEGRRDGSAIHFTKRYDARERQHYAVEYDGTLSADGDEITGKWTIRGQWSGSFIMVRRSPVADGVTERIAETVD